MSDLSSLFTPLGQVATYPGKVAWDGYSPWVSPAQVNVMPSAAAAGASQVPLTTMPSAAPTAASAGMDMGNVAGAGITAAGQTVGMIAQIAGEQQARDTIQAANNIQRQWQEKMALEQLKQQANMFNQAANAQAYHQLYSAFGGDISNSFNTRELQRRGTANAADAFATAYLGK